MPSLLTQLGLEPSAPDALYPRSVMDPEVATGVQLGRQPRPSGSEAGAAAVGPAPCECHMRWLREIQSTLRERPERARQLLGLLCQDLGLTDIPSTDILYRNMAFLNLVDPISYDLLARDLQCPKMDKLWKSSDKICRQLIYHRAPHSTRQQGSSLPRKKTQSWSGSSLQKTLAGEAGSLSGVLLSARGVQHITRFLGGQGGLAVLGLSFAELRELLRLLLPGPWTPPRLSQLLLNGTAAWEPTEAVKDTAKFTALARVDLGNNVDVASLPQPLLVGLCRRLSQHTSPTIFESLGLEPEGKVARATAAAPTWGSAAAGPGSEPQAFCTR
ncbi:LOW QUALITY PROTEIN: leucine-rich repeat-containing protein 75B [Molossus nigricans]